LNELTFDLDSLRVYVGHDHSSPGIKGYCKTFSFAPILPQNNPKRIVNRHFQAQLAQHSNSHISKATLPISNQILHNDKDQNYSSWVVSSRRKHWDGGLPPSWKIENGHILARFDRSARNFAWWRTLTLLTLPAMKILNIYKCQKTAAICFFYKN